MFGERNPQSEAEEFAPPPQGESVLDASMMAELIVTKKEIAPQLQKSTGTSRARPKSPSAGGQRLPLAGRLRAEQSILWFLSSGRFWLRGSLPQFGRRLKTRSERIRRRGHRSLKAIRKIGGRESANGAAPLASLHGNPVTTSAAREERIWQVVNKIRPFCGSTEDGDYHGDTPL